MRGWKHLFRQLPTTLLLLLVLACTQTVPEMSGIHGYLCDTIERRDVCADSSF